MKKGLPYYALHDVRCWDKVERLVTSFDKDKAMPILCLEDGSLINGTHRFSAYVKRMELGYTGSDNFRIVCIDDYPNCWVMKAINDYLLSQDDTRYIDIDYFWHDHYVFSEAYIEE